MLPNNPTPSTTPVTRRIFRVPVTTTTPTPGRQVKNVTTPGSVSRAGPTGDLPPSVLFDEIMRHYDNFINYSSELEFLEFINSQEDCRKKWYSSDQEVLRLKVENENYRTDQQRSEKQMGDFRRQFATKLEVVARLEGEVDSRRNRINSGINLCTTYLNDTRVSADTKDRIGNVLAVLEGVETKRSSNSVPVVGVLDPISEADTTDLSMTHSEDDLDISIPRRTRRQSKRRSNEFQLDEDYTRTRKRIRKRNGAGQVVDSSGAMDQVVSKTVVTIPRSGGPIQATSTLETVPFAGYVDEKIQVAHSLQPSAPPMTGSSDTDSDQPSSTLYIMKPHHNTRSSISKADKEIMESPRIGRTLSTTGGNLRNHSWVTKTVMAPETCGQCNKKIHFAKLIYKCKGCKAACHPDCRDKVPIPCIAVLTPSANKGEIGVIADYAPKTHPMVPALIQHCVNEIEVNGLTSEGLYRVRGMEREIKQLKDRFLRGKSVPNLSLCDPHVLCGCIKDFLRTLREPLVGRHFWRDFALATDITDPKKRQIEIHRALEELPPPNQDTLAFMILHLQKIAEVDEVKMPLTNMAKIFGPCLIGYSSNELSSNAILLQTKKQQTILSTLLNMSPEYWTKFLKRTDVELPGPVTRKRTSRFSSVGRARGGTYSASSTAQVHPQPQVQTQPANNKQASKKIYFHDDSPQGTLAPTRPKRNYFD